MRRTLRISASVILLAFFVAHWSSAPALANSPGQAAYGTINVAIDAVQAPRKLFHSHLVIPASPGPLTLYYPKWIPGEHGPTGPIVNLAGLRFTSGGKRISWRRDDVDMYTFHLQVPPGADSVQVDIDFLSPGFEGGFTAGASTTAHLAIVTWNQLVLYPEGKTPDQLSFSATLKLPTGWKYGTALPVAGESGSVISFAPVSLVTLIDSPVLAGEYFRVIPLATTAPTNEIDIAADSAADLRTTPETDRALRKLVAEAGALFGAYHYEHYHFLFTLSDHVAHFGLEHHQSNDSRVPERSLVDPSVAEVWLDVLSHEFVHSWNGKYRRPAGLATPDYQQPMKGELLWVYEGLTEYLGMVLAARSGLLTPGNYRDLLAETAAGLEHRPGREWRPLIDTTIAAQILYSAPSEWSSLRRSVDFYDEGWLIWLDADTLIRQQTNGRCSLDDFCKRFHGGQTGPPMLKTYTYDDVLTTLNEVAPYDWRGFFDTRLNAIGPRAPLSGIERGGWKLIYNSSPNPSLNGAEEEEKTLELGYSLGLRLKDDGTVVDVIQGSPADGALIGPGMKILAINGRQWSPVVLRDALDEARNSSGPMQLLIANEDDYRTYSINYHGGQQIPHLERDNSRPDLMSQILAPLTGR